MDYFYTQPEKIATASLIIDGDEFTHLTHVMRKRVGDTIRIVDGLGTAYDAVIKEITKKLQLRQLSKPTKTTMNTP